MEKQPSGTAEAREPWLWMGDILATLVSQQFVLCIARHLTGVYEPKLVAKREGGLGQGYCNSQPKNKSRWLLSTVVKAPFGTLAFRVGVPRPGSAFDPTSC